MRSPVAHVDTRLTSDVRHQAIVVRLVVEIATCLKQHPVGRVFVAPLDVVLSNHDIVEPDVLFVATDQTGILTDKNVQGPPALVVEVLSHSTRKRDAQAKRRLFERTGVREYWLVDPELDTVRVLRLSADAKLVRVAELSADDDEVLTTHLLPECAIGLRALFE